jgi:2-polyprenyl-6-hydroxyphenyl methylase/3-demethylubiquinone-9 3-methyltransferase
MNQPSHESCERLSPSVFRRFINTNIAASRALDRLLPAHLRRDGNTDFRDRLAPAMIPTDAVVFDLGGGSRPFIDPETKAERGLFVTGLDIDGAELERAPSGAYDRTVVADLTTFRGEGDAAMAICQATLEHVKDNRGAVAAIASCLKPGGHACLFAPGRNALFAILNRVLPEGPKQRLLFAVFPHKAQGHDGFPAYYDHCTPKRMERLFAANGLEVVERRLYWTSSYFFAFTPAYLAWRAYQALAYGLVRHDAAETFAYLLRKR